jgi:TetR/AcrR family transcriptional repressor of nem operon
MKNSNDTRQKLIDITYDEIYEKGYQAASLSEILSKAQVHKGSMYYFFENKKEMAMSALKEKLSERFTKRYATILTYESNILNELFKVLNDISLRDFKKGCPLANIVQEMSNLDVDFDAMSKGFYEDFRGIIKDILDKAILLKELKDCDTQKLALYITVVVEGAILATKATGNEKDYLDSIECLQEYIRSNYGK